MAATNSWGIFGLHFEKSAEARNVYFRFSDAQTSQKFVVRLKNGTSKCSDEANGKAVQNIHLLESHSVISRSICWIFQWEKHNFTYVIQNMRETQVNKSLLLSSLRWYRVSTRRGECICLCYFALRSLTICDAELRTWRNNDLLRFFCFEKHTRGDRCTIKTVYRRQLYPFKLKNPTEWSTFKFHVLTLEEM